MKLLVFCCFLLPCIKVFSSSTDSLRQLLYKTVPDTTQLRILKKLTATEFESNFYDSSFLHAQQQIIIAEKYGKAKEKGDALNIMGAIQKVKGDYNLSLKYYSEAYSIFVAIRDQEGVSLLLNNIGLLYREKGELDKSLNYQFKSLKIKEELNDKKSISIALSNIGILYLELKNYDKALEYFLQAINILKKAKDKKGVAGVFIDIAQIYKEKKDYNRSLSYYNQALSIFKDMNDLKNMAVIYNNIATIYGQTGDYEKEISFHFKSLDIEQQMKDDYGIAKTYYNLAISYGTIEKYDVALDYIDKALTIQQKMNDRIMMATSLEMAALIYLGKDDYKNALNSLNKSLDIALLIGNKEMLALIYSDLSDTYSLMKDYKNSMDFYKLYMELKDSIFNETSQKNLAEMQTKYETDKKEKEIDILNKDKKIRETEISKQKTVRNYLFGVVGLVLVLILVLWVAYNNKKKANSMLEKQKMEIAAQRDEIEEINNELTDSIRYALRIQKAILPKIDDANLLFKEYFIIFKPKDIVSGDFYWFNKRKNIRLIAVADCTGHGVPGAFMSMLGISFLNEIVSREEVTMPSHVLDEMRFHIIKSLQQKGHSEEQKDGMDMVFIALDSNTNQLQFTGANNSLYLAKRGSSTEEVRPLEEWKGDKMPVAIHSLMAPFTTHDVKIFPGDILYICSDGYADQFGGPNGKKFLLKNLKLLLSENFNRPMNEQKTILEESIENWMSPSCPNAVKFPQTDDITLIGIKI